MTPKRRVFVYYNLRKKTWSVKALNGPDRGRVIQHGDLIIVRNAQGRVSEAGRQQVMRERRKNVHAGIVEELATEATLTAGARRVTYDPYKNETFIYADDGSPFTGSDAVVMAGKRVYAS